MEKHPDVIRVLEWAEATEEAIQSRVHPTQARMTLEHLPPELQPVLTICKGRKWVRVDGQTAFSPGWPRLTERGAGELAEHRLAPTTPPAGSGVETAEPKAGKMSSEEAAERLEELRQQGEPFTSQKRLGKQIGCSASTVNKAIRETESLHGWAYRQKKPTVQSIDEMVTDRTPEGRELDPADEAAIREFIEKADPETKAWFLALPVEEQLTVVSDPDKHLSDPEKRDRLLGRKP